MRSKRKVKIRKKWHINPRTKVRESRKLYSRRRQKKRLKKELDSI